MLSLIAMVGISAVSAVGAETSDTFTQTTLALGSGEPAITTTTPELTPKGKWEKAKADWEAAVDGADDKYKATR